ncbi:hypothetical protein NKH89_02615 [Mesorhizobium sp. M0923]
MMSRFAAVSDVALGIAEVMKPLLHGGRIRKGKITMATDQRQALDMVQLQPRYFRPAVFQKTIEASSQ